MFNNILMCYCLIEYITYINHMLSQNPKMYDLFIAIKLVLYKKNVLI